MLRYSAHELAYDISCKALDLINNRELYDILLKEMPKKYVDLYFKKIVYEAFLPIAHQVVIYQYNKEHNDNNLQRVIDASGFPCRALIQEIWPEKNVDLSFSYPNQINSETTNSVQKITKKIKSLIGNFYFMNKTKRFVGKPYSPTAKIAVNYQEGFSNNKRSDIFWFNNSGIDPDAIVVYYENPHGMTRHDDEGTAQQFFDGQGINQVRLWEWNASNSVKPYDLIINEIESNECSKDLDKWIKKTALHLCNRSSYWRDFFEHWDIMIHLDPTESGHEIILKQIALDNVGGLSLGKMRSYPTNLEGSFPTYYPYNVFFSWGIDSAKNIHELNDFIDELLISGFPYNSKISEQDSDRIITSHYMKVTKKKFSVLLIDSNHGGNKGLRQLIPAPVMVSFYQAILDWVKQDEDIELVIKPKKSRFLDKLPGIMDQISECARSTDRVTLVKDSFQKMPNSYLNGIDMVIGISAFFPSAVIECVVHNARAVFYDYPNLRHHEGKFYQWAENRVVFPDLDDMVSAVKAYKNAPSRNPLLGDWSEHLDELDPFRDHRGGERIGTYIRWLQEGFEENLDRVDAIARANGLYAETWGEDKVYLSERSLYYA